MENTNQEVINAFSRAEKTGHIETEIDDEGAEAAALKINMGAETLFTGLIDLSNPDLYNPARERYKKSKNGETKHSFVSVYMRSDEKKHLEELSKKYKMSIAAIVRMLIINAK